MYGLINRKTFFKGEKPSFHFHSEDEVNLNLTEQVWGSVSFYSIWDNCKYRAYCVLVPGSIVFQNGCHRFVGLGTLTVGGYKVVAAVSD